MKCTVYLKFAGKPVAAFLYTIIEIFASSYSCGTVNRNLLSLKGVGLYLERKF